MSRHGTGARIVAAPTLGERGGGVGQMARLLWDAVAETWASDAQVVTLLTNGHAVPTAVDKLRFGGAIAARQVLGRPAWIAFAHLGIAQVEGVLPASVRAPYAVFLHGIECWDRLPPRERRTLARARVRIANSEFTAARTTRSNPEVGSIAVCRLALMRDEAVDTGAARPPASPTVLIVGRMSATERYKGHDELLAAWPGVVASVPEARLVIVGDGDDRTRLQTLARCSSASGSIEFRGFVPRRELRDLYAGAAVFAMPSRGEGFGLVYLEAMKHGLPCVGSVCDAASEIIRDGETGLLVDPADPDALGRALVGLLTDPEWRRRLGAAGRARLNTEFTYERFRRDVTRTLSGAFDTGGEPPR